MLAASTAARRRKRPRVLLLLTTVAIGLLPSVAGFGLSSVGAPTIPATAVGVVSDGLLLSRGSAAAAAALHRTARCGGLQQQQQQQRRRGGRKRQHEITCKVSSPRRYGSAVSLCYKCSQCFFVCHDYLCLSHGRVYFPLSLSSVCSSTWAVWYPAF